MVLSEPSFGTKDLIPNFIKWIFDNLTNGNGDIGGSVILLLLGYVSFLMFRSASFETAMATSGLITVFISFFFLKMGWIGTTGFILAIIWFVVGLFYLIKESSGREI